MSVICYMGISLVVKCMIRMMTINRDYSNKKDVMSELTKYVFFQGTALLTALSGSFKSRALLLDIDRLMD